MSEIKNNINPRHYQQVPGIETIEITRHFNFNLGNAIKYIMRAGHKDSKRQDLVKAIWYCLDEIYKDNPQHKEQVNFLKVEIEELNKNA